MCFPGLCMSGAQRVSLPLSEAVWACCCDDLPERAKPSWGLPERVCLEEDLAGRCRPAAWPGTTWQNLIALTKKYAFVNLLANRGHVLFPGFSFLFPNVSLVTRGAQRELPWKPKSLIISPALSSCLSHCLSQSKLYYPRGGQS